MQTTAKVQELHREAIPFSVPLDKLDTYHGVKLVAGLLRKWERKNVKENTFKNLAKKVDLSPQTVARIASEDTKSPRLHTILMIMKGIGFSAVRFE
jgi:DNA-binding phage protein